MFLNKRLTVCFLMVVSCVGIPLFTFAADDTISHPDYNQKVLELKGKNVFQFELPDIGTLTVVGLPKDLDSGNYKTIYAFPAPHNSSPKLFCMADFKDNHLKQVALSDGRIIDFQNNTTTDYNLTWRGWTNGLERKYVAQYRNKTLEGAFLQIGTNVRMDYDGQGNMTALYFGEGIEAKRLTYKMGEEVALGIQPTQEFYSHSGRRLAQRQFLEGGPKPQLSEYDIKEKWAFSVFQIKDGTMSDRPIALENISKYNVAQLHTATGELSRITNVSNVFGEITSYRKEVTVDGSPSTAPQWKVIQDTAWQVPANAPQQALAQPQSARHAAASDKSAETAIYIDSVRFQAIEAATIWLTLMDQGAFRRSWQAAAPYLQSITTVDKFGEVLRTYRTPLGSLVDRQVQQTQYTTTMPAAPDGEYLMIIYATRFEKKQSAIETLTVRKGSDGVWRVSGYYIK